jgi:ParB family chromosome partitioning protein
MSPPSGPEQAPSSGTEADSGPTDAGVTEGITQVLIDRIAPNRHQPRSAFNEDRLQDLANSIRQDGMMQPIIVRRLTEPTAEADFELVAGERRWRAARMAGLTRVPAIVRDLGDQQIAEWALVENLQREDLNAMERADAFRGLIDRFGLTQSEVAERVGLAHSSVSNTLSLTKLCPEVQDLLRTNQLSEGAARPLRDLPEEEQLELARLAIQKRWTVRRMESECAARKAGDQKPPGRRADAAEAHYQDLAQQIGAELQTQVRIKKGRGNGKGTVTIHYHSIDHFNALVQKLGVRLDER